MTGRVKERSHIGSDIPTSFKQGRGAAGERALRVITAEGAPDVAPHIFTDKADPLLSGNDAAVYLGYSQAQTLHNLRSQGIGPRATKIPGHTGTFYRMSDLMVWSLDRYLARVAKAVAS